MVSDPRAKITMSETDLAALVQRRVEDSLGTFGDQLSADRIESLQYYRGEPFGDEVEGRSKVVTHDVAEAVDSLMPPLLKVFLAGDKVVIAEPVGPEDEEGAEQATDYANHVFLQQNDGFGLVYTTLKDGLLFKTGVAKVWWDDTPQTTEERYQGVTEEQLFMLQSDTSIEIEIEEQDEEPEPGQGVNVIVTRTGIDGQCRMAPIPPEEFLIDRYATKITQATADGPLFTGHRQLRTVSDVVEEYPDKRDLIEAMAGIGGDADYSGERRERWALESPGQIPDQDENDQATRPVWVVEAYVRVDYDGDGIAELRKVTCVGEVGYEILDNEQVDDNPFAAWSPILMPHKFHGMSVADQIRDLQRVKTTLFRGMLNNAYFVNEPMTKVVKDHVDLDQLLNRRVGGVVEMQALTDTEEMVVPPMMQYLFPVLEYVDAQREQRTGVTRYSQGLDAESLNKTATGISIIQDAAQQRQELIARVYAEVFMKRMFQLILGCVAKYQKAARMIRLRGKWVEMDPRSWKNSYDMTVTVGLGTGNRDQQAVHAMNVLNIQKELLVGGKANMVPDKNIYNTLEKLIEAIGWKSAEPYFTPPDDNQQQQQQPPQDPKAMEVQAKAQLNQQKEQMDHEYRMTKLERDHQVNMRKAELDAGVKEMSAQHDAGVKGWAAGQDARRKKGTADAEVRIKRTKEGIDQMDSDLEEHEETEKKVGEIAEAVENVPEQLADLVSLLSSVTTQVKTLNEQINAPKVIDVKRRGGKIVGADVIQAGRTSTVTLQ